MYGLVPIFTNPFVILGTRSQPTGSCFSRIGCPEFETLSPPRIAGAIRDAELHDTATRDSMSDDLLLIEGLRSLDFTPRTRVVYGRGTVDALGESAHSLGFRRVLLVSDPGIRAAGHVDRAVESLLTNVEHVAVFDGVEENPTTEHVGRGLAVAREHNVDSIVGLGGGSAMDCAKGVNFVLTNGGRMQDYWGVGKAHSDMLPMIAVPTTAGTGSEAQSFALISDAKTHQKMACGDHRAACKVALLDPELTLSMPRDVAAATGIDALSHAVESHVTTRRTPVSQAFSREAWKLLSANIVRSSVQPDDVEARGSMLLGACLAGFAIENSMLGAAHSLANPLTARYGVVHGQAVGLMLPHVVRYNAAQCATEYAELAAFVDDDVDELEAVELVALRIEDIRRDIGLPAALRDVGVESAKLSELAAEAAGQWTAQFNPRSADRDDMEELYRCAL